MRIVNLILVSIFLLVNISLFSQEVSDKVSIDSISEIKGLVFEFSKRSPLAFTNIGITDKSRGTVSNENGRYRLNIDGLKDSDTVNFQFVGYKTFRVTIGELVINPNVYLKEDLINIGDFFVYGNNIDAKAIVKKVLKNKKKNYRSKYTKSEMFIRNRYATNIKEVKLRNIKNSFNEIKSEITKNAVQNIPRKQLSYTDFLGNVYLQGKLKGAKSKENGVKLFPIKVIALKDDADYSELENLFIEIFKKTKKNEYWKVATGVFSTKVNLEEDAAKNDSISNVVDYKNTMGTWFFTEQINRSVAFVSMDDDKYWDFLHNTSKYNYTLFGGTTINGEDVYIVDFEPGWRGNYQGRLYISCSTFALLKAEYKYAPGRDGTNINLLGISFAETIFRVIIIFEKHGDKYQLKYLFKQEGEYVGIKRKVSLLKKRKRFILDKTLAKYKVGIIYKAENLNSTEILIISEKNISKKQYEKFKQKKRMKVKYVSQFDDKLWQNHSIIAPTSQMKNYRKK